MFGIIQLLPYRSENKYHVTFPLSDLLAFICSETNYNTNHMEWFNWDHHNSTVMTIPITESTKDHS